MSLADTWMNIINSPVHVPHNLIQLPGNVQFWKGFNTYIFSPFYFCIVVIQQDLHFFSFISFIFCMSFVSSLTFPFCVSNTILRKVKLDGAKGDWFLGKISARSYWNMSVCMHVEQYYGFRYRLYVVITRLHLVFYLLYWIMTWFPT